jgi:hypothetical protein
MKDRYPGERRNVLVAVAIVVLIVLVPALAKGQSVLIVPVVLAVAAVGTAIAWIIAPAVTRTTIALFFRNRPSRISGPHFPDDNSEGSVAPPRGTARRTKRRNGPRPSD